MADTHGLTHCTPDTTLTHTNISIKHGFFAFLFLRSI